MQTVKGMTGTMPVMLQFWWQQHEDASSRPASCHAGACRDELERLKEIWWAGWESNPRCPFGGGLWVRCLQPARRPAQRCFAMEAGEDQQKDPVWRPGLSVDWPTYYTKTGLPGSLRWTKRSGSPDCLLRI